MKRTFALVVLTLTLIAGCQQPENKVSQPAVVQNPEEDKARNEDLIRRTYRWQESDTTRDDYITGRHDSMYVGVEMNRHARNLEHFRQAGLFAEEFIANYDHVVRTIDSKLRSGELEWPVGDIPPFGEEVDPWYRLQDMPFEHGWEKFEFAFRSIDTAHASLTWSWGQTEGYRDFRYNVRVAKENGTWRIAYLEGFDFETCTKRDY